MRNSELAAISEGQSHNHNKIHSREEVIKCPHMMVLLGYLQEKHELPKYGWRRKGLRYHYTDAAGLLGIIENSRLWASELRFLNDPSEGGFLPEQLLELMRSKPGGVSNIEECIIKGLERALLNPRWNDSTFAVSLSINGDLLSQWRGYGNFGRGYAVGLNFEGMLPHPQIASYYDVVYGDNGLSELALDLLDLFVSATGKWGGIMDDEWANTLNVLAKSFKDPSYSEEQESRLVCSYSEGDKNNFHNELPLKFRARGSDIVPYIPISLDLLKDGDEPRLPLEHIVVGPGVDFKRNYASINALLRAHSYHNVEVQPSVIPFRS